MNTVRPLRFNDDHRSAPTNIPSSGHVHGRRSVVLTNFGQTFPMFGGHRLTGPVESDPQANKTFTEQGRVSRGEYLSAQADHLRDRFDQRSCETALGFSLDPGLPVTGLLGDAQNGLDRTGSEFAFQPWDQFVPQAVSREGRTRVRLIDKAGLLETCQAIDDFFASNAEEWSPERHSAGEGANFGNARKASESRPAKEVMEDGFGVVVGSVASDDGCGLCLLGHADEGRVPGVTSLLLDGCQLFLGKR